MVTGESFTCVCKEGWEGPTCTQSKCTLNCEWEIDGQVLLFKDDRCPATLCKVLHLIILDSPIPSVLQYFFFPFHLPSLAAAGHEKGGGGAREGLWKVETDVSPPRPTHSRLCPLVVAFLSKQ